MRLLDWTGWEVVATLSWMRLRVTAGWAATALLGALGCGQTSAAHESGSGAGSGGGRDAPQVMGLDFVQSGSRLLALGYSSNEARIFRTFHDRELGFDCTFVSDAAGRDLRCVPTDEVTMVYTDAGCTEPAAWADGPQQRSLVAGDAVSGGRSLEVVCPGDAPAPRNSYRVAERLREEGGWGPLDGFFQVYGGRCQTASPPAKAVPSVVRLVPIPESDLARAQRTNVDVGGGLRLTRLLADDGARLTLGVTGADRTPCEFQTDGECVPEPIARPASLLDDKFHTAVNADCSAPAFQMPYQSACGVPTFGVAEDAAGGLRVQAMVRPSAVFGLDLVVPVIEPNRFSCTPKEIGDYVWVAAAGRDVTGTLPTASRRRQGAGELHVDWFTLGGRELLPAVVDFRRAMWGEVPQARFANSEGRSCDVMPAEGGTLHCVVPEEYGSRDVTSFPEVVAFTY